MLRRLVVVLIVVLCALVPLASAQAATGGGIGTWTPLTGSAGDYDTSVQVPALGFPLATAHSDSRAGSVGVVSGASTWFGASSPAGEYFGSSRDEPYLNLRPKADNAASPSVTTYTFARATPVGWGFVLGDVDSDEVKVTATLADGSSATAADLGFRGVFNDCATSPRPSGCSSDQKHDTPTWTAATHTLRGNADAEDTYGASGWFVPTQPLRTVTFTFTRRAGFPVYQTWFGVRTQDVSGTVSVTTGPCDVSGLTVDLVDAQGDVAASTTTGAGGTYSFEGVTAGPGQVVRLASTSPGCVAAGSGEKAVDLTDGDAVADFAVHHAPPVAISGHVLDAVGRPVVGATVTLGGPGGPRTATTDADGGYLFDGNDVGTYPLSVTTPDGYVLDTSPSDAVVGAGTTEPITDKDFTLTKLGSITGTVTDTTTDEPVPGATVVVDGPGDAHDVTLTTDDAGTFTADDLPSGAYTATLTVPDGDAASGETTKTATITAAGEHRALDFAVTSPTSGSGGGTSGLGGGSTLSGGGSTTATLPDTGGTSIWWLVGGVVVVLLGIGAVVAGRRRR